jgi:hypothetical protein
MKHVLKVKLLALAFACNVDAANYKVTVLSTADHTTYFHTGCTILFESSVHHAFEATCEQYKHAHRPFQAEPRNTDYALRINDLFFYNCELVGSWSGGERGNRIFHCGAILENSYP